MIYYRVTYNNKGIYNILKEEIFNKYDNAYELWNNLKTSTSFTWLPIPPNYKDNNKSYFTKLGLNKFKKETLNIITKYLDESKIEITKFNIIEDKIIYQDKYQIVVKES